MSKRNSPRRGSIAYSPRKRAKKQVPRISHWPKAEEAGLLGFAGYKAGMTHAMAVDKRDHSPTSDLKVFVPVTVVETPPLKVIGVRAYVKGYSGKNTFTDIIVEEKKSKKKKKETSDSKKKMAELEERKNLTNVTLIVATQPDKTNMPKKKPDVMEIALGGEIAGQLAYAKEKIGGEIKASEILKENTLSDITAITKGKGRQGPVKRWGIRLQTRKSTSRHRHIGTGGAWTPARKLWREPQGGQTGYHRRTEYNKLVLKVGEKGSEVTPAGGFLRYGPVSGEYVLLYGSVAGPTKRLIRFTRPRRPKKAGPYEITDVNISSKQGV